MSSDLDSLDDLSAALGTTPEDVINMLTTTAGFTDKVSLALATELAAELCTPAEVLAKFGVSPQEFKKIAATPMFKQRFKEAKAMWNSNTNAVARIHAKNTMVAEDLILDAYKRATDPSTSNDSFAKLWKLIIDSSSAAPVKNVDVAETKKFSISINIGDTSSVIDGVTKTPLVEDGEFVEVP